jgi:type IV secretory pathway component VirB8
MALWISRLLDGFYGEKSSPGAARARRREPDELPIPPVMASGRMTGHPAATYQGMARYQQVVILALLTALLASISANLVLILHKDTDVKIVQSLEANERFFRVSTLDRSIPARNFVERQFCLLYVRLREEITNNKAENDRRWNRDGELGLLHSSAVDEQFRASRDYFDVKDQFERLGQVRTVEWVSKRGPEKGQCQIHYRAVDRTVSGKDIRTQQFEAIVYFASRKDYRPNEQEADLNPLGLVVVDYARRPFTPQQ